ncbi:MAG TPA: hypothetical protein PLG55_08400 [Methanospirillum sp.]|jgi:hypothetical protein|uniref:hypothetical protein n=1 Tax=Methanospirillum sp. TaxID=45200 RepID=UPI0016B4B76E|nr:hypothetical protein [Methanospirillum sp.]NLW75941.1 hypothetical protein [Methanomicrobiales archaeon]HPY60728.1 hypothetical protein [Methanospirillum sp.]HQB99215.1 hypothetical protein [Methanospirillum sp.]
MLSSLTNTCLPRFGVVFLVKYLFVEHLVRARKIGNDTVRSLRAKTTSLQSSLMAKATTSSGEASIREGVNSAAVLVRRSDTHPGYLKLRPTVLTCRNLC